MSVCFPNKWDWWQVQRLIIYLKHLLSSDCAFVKFEPHTRSWELLCRLQLHFQAVGFLPGLLPIHLWLSIFLNHCRSYFFLYRVGLLLVSTTLDFQFHSFVDIICLLILNIYNLNLPVSLQDRMIHVLVLRETGIHYSPQFTSWHVPLWFRPLTILLQLLCYHILPHWKKLEKCLAWVGGVSFLHKSAPP